MLNVNFLIFQILRKFGGLKEKRRLVASHGCILEMGNLLVLVEE